MGKKYSDEELLEIMVEYNNNVGFPTTREFKASNGLPSATTYKDVFGSFKNAILISGIEIPKERQRYFNRESLSDEVLLKLIKYYTDKKLENNIFLLTYEEVDNTPGIPHSATYTSRFGNIENVYTKLGINYVDYNKKALEKDMIIQYKNLCMELGHVANSREINKASKEGKCYGITTYTDHFGTLYELQKYCNFTPSNIGRNLTKEETIDNLYLLSNEIDDIPKQKDIYYCNYLPGVKKICEMFGSIREMQNELFGETYSKVKVTNKGTVCNSSYEYIFAKMLENYNIDFTKEEYYKDYIKDFDKNYRFDYTVMINNEKYFIEIFGITNNEKYDEKTKEKIKLCKDNNLKLIELYPSDFYEKRQKDFYLLLLDKIKEVNGFK